MYDRFALVELAWYADAREPSDIDLDQSHPTQPRNARRFVEDPALAGRQSATCTRPLLSASARTVVVGVAVFSGRFLGSKLIPSKWRCLVLPDSRLAQPCRDTPALTRVLRDGYPAEGMRGLRKP